MAYTKYSLTPANNTATPPDGAPEGMLPSAVNDTMRDMMAQIRDCGDGIRDGTYTMTAPKITGGTITGVTLTGNTFSNPTITGVSTFAAGTVSAPAITTTGDTNTGIFFPAADTIAFTEGGAEAMRIDSAGQVGVGVTPNTWSTGKVVEVGASGTSLWGLSSGTSYVTAGYYFNSTDKFALTGNYAIFYQLVPADGSFRWHSSTATGTAGNNATMSERMRIDSSGRLLINTTTARTTLDGDRSALVQIEGLSVDQSMSMFRNENGAFGPTFWIGKSRGTTAGSNTVVQNGDGLGSILFLGSDGTKPVQSALIAAYVDGTPGTNDMPGRLVFFTTADGASSVTERMRINSVGTVLVGKTTDSLSVAGTYISPLGEIGITQSGGAPLFMNRLVNDGTLVQFRQDDTTEGSISVSGTTVSYNGGHLSRYAQTLTSKDDSLVKGTVLSNLDEMNEYVRPTTYWTEEDELPEGVNVGDVKEESKIVDNEQLNKVKVSDVEGDVNVAGVFVNWSHDEQHNVDEINMAMTGDMIIRIAQGVVVQKGNLLMSAGDGTAKPQGDDIVRSKTIAKVTSSHITCTYADGSYCVPCVLMAC